MQKKNFIALMAAGCLLVGAGVVYAANDTATEKAELFGDQVEYNVKTGQMKADGHVKMTRGTATVTGNKADYNTKTQSGHVIGNVVADQDDTHLTCDVFTALSQTAFVAEGSVHGTKADRMIDGPIVEYNSETGYGRMPSGGTLGAQGGTMTADFIEGWEKEQHVKARGNVHVVQPSRSFEGGGDEGEYFGLENGKTIFDGNAWAIQENNTLHSKHLVVYLNENQNQDKQEAAAEEE